MAEIKDKDAVPGEEKIEYEIDSKEKEQYDLDQQVEMKDDRPLGEELVEEWQFTWRASIVGSLLGCLVGKYYD